MATAPPEPLGLDTVKDYLRVLDDVEDDKITAMIPRARLWVEEHTGLAIVQRAFEELHTPRAGVVRLSRAPLISLDSCGYDDGSGETADFAATAVPPSTKLTGQWPTTAGGTPFRIAYTAGLTEGAIDDRLLGAMLALIEGEYSAGYAYPPDTVTAATNCLFYMKFQAP